MDFSGADVINQKSGSLVTRTTGNVFLHGVGLHTSSMRRRGFIRRRRSVRPMREQSRLMIDLRRSTVNRPKSALEPD